jgi:hypothetical protein
MWIASNKTTVNVFSLNMIIDSENTGFVVIKVLFVSYLMARY